jgi:ABC-type transporter Mla subunit MlaD
MKAANEIRVGIVVVAALALMVGGYFYLRGSGLGADLYYVRLNSAAIVAAGNDVRLQGVKIGQVQDVVLDPGTQKPVLTLAVRRNNPPFSLYRSYRYAVKSSGIIGESYLDIQGNLQSGDVAYSPNDASQVIPGRAAPGLFDVGDQTGEVVKDLRVTLAKFNTTLDNINKGVLAPQNQMKLAQALEGVTRLTTQASRSFGPNGVKLGFGDPNTQRYLNSTLMSAALAANEAGLAARDVRKLTVSASGVLNQTGGVIHQAGGVMQESGAVLHENRGQLKRLLVNLDRTTTSAADTLESVNFLVKNSDLDKTVKNAGGSIERAAKNIEDTTASFKSLSDESTQKELRATITALRESTEALRDTARSINTFVAEPGTQGQLKSTLATLNTTATTLAETTANLRDATAGIKNVLGDEKVQSDFKAIPAELRKTLESTSATAERINSLLGGRRKKSDTTQTGDGKNDGKKGDERSDSLLNGLDFTYRYLPDAENDRRNFGDIRFQTELFGAPFRLGLDNIGEGTDLTLQTGRFFGKNAAIRYGIYRSKLGIGADYNLGRFSLEGNLYDPNDRSYNLYGGFKITPQFEVLLGREHQGNVRSNAIGVRLRP